MSIENYGELKDALSVYMFHQRFVPQYNNATTLFETAANRRLRVRQQQHTVYLTLNADGACDLPLDYLQWRAVNWTGGRTDLATLTYGRNPFVPLDYVHPAYLRSTWPAADNGNPKVFTIEGSTFCPRPVDLSTAAFEFIYFQLIPTITGVDRITGEDAGGENWLLFDYPDAYLYGVLTELMALGRNAAAATLYKQRRDEVFAEIERVSSFTTGATSALVRTADYY